METGAGFLAFDAEDELFSGTEEIDGDYARHCRAAREVAEEFFDARKVLTNLIESALGGG